MHFSALHLTAQISYRPLYVFLDIFPLVGLVDYYKSCLENVQWVNGPIKMYIT